MRFVDVLVVGAGPSGSCASAVLHKNGLDVLCIEKEIMPRFVIGESLLPNSLNYLLEAGFLDAIKRAGFQYKNGAAFSFGDLYRYFDFADKSTPGFGSAYEVKRAEFDKLLADEAIKQGVEIRFNTSAIGFDFKDEFVDVSLDNGDTIRAKFIVDASGYGRVLPRALDLEVPSTLSPKKAYFTHIKDNITHMFYDRDKILITTHPDMREVWYWLIPFSDGRCSIGVVGEERYLDVGLDEESTLKKHVYDAPILKILLENSQWDTATRSISGYSKDVSRLYGDRFILLGNATEFLDPVFSSGITIALHSAISAAKCVTKKLRGEEVDFDKEYVEDLMVGVDAFRAYVEGWYRLDFQDVIYAKEQNIEVKRKICSILAGYAWDKNNIFVTRPVEALASVHAYCK